MATLTAVVKSILSSDTLVLRGKLLQPSILPKERVLHLEGITGPRVGNRDRIDEPLAFEAREYLRALLVGKEVTFTVSHTVSTTTPPLEFGIVYASAPTGKVDVALETVRAGWAKVREQTNPKSSGAQENEEDPSSSPSRKQLLKQAEEEAKNAGKGMWSSKPILERTVKFGMPDEPVSFLSEHKGKLLDAIIEATPNGSTVRARLIISTTLHYIVNVGIAGVRAPRASSPGGPGGDSTDSSQAEEYGDEARYFVESRLLQRMIRITLLSLPTPNVAPASFSSTSSTTPATTTPVSPSMFLGTIHHPAGNIAALLLSSGLAKVVDWHAGFLSQSPTPTMMAELRKAESEAKVGRRALWKSLPAPSPAAAAIEAQKEKERKWEGLVTRVWGADMISVVKEGESTEKRLQLSSVRQPRPTDPKVAGLQAEGKEILRKKLIGKQVSVIIDYVKAAEGDFEARDCATIKLSNGTNVAEMLVERGLVSVIRHRQGEEQRSSEYDKLVAAEAKAVIETKGLHSGKEFPQGRIIDASESSQKATPFLSSFKRAGRVSAVVDFVAAGSRFKLFVPKQGVKLTLVLSGIRAPRTARNPSEKSEPFGQEAASFASRKFLQRDVEFLVEATDKSGGFIGKMFLDKVDVAVLLLKEGLARVDEYAVERGGAKELVAAQEEAKKLRKNIWNDYDPEAEAAEAAVNGTNGHAAHAVARKEYVDVVISDVRGAGETPFSFALQVLKNGGIAELETLMSDLTLHNQSNDVTPTNFVPRVNDVITAKFTADDTWYRARIRRCNPSKKEAEVMYLDYGNSEVVPFSRLRPLPAQFKGLDAQAKKATLSFVTLLGSETEYGLDALERFRDLCEGRQLVANIDSKEANLLHVSLFDPSDPNAAVAHENSINVSLVREGLARIDARSRFRAAYPNVVATLENASAEAKRNRAGAYELGDIFDD